MLSKLRENVDIICRERKTYNHVTKFSPKANVMLAHDLAFSLDVNNLLSVCYVRLLYRILLLKISAALKHGSIVTDSSIAPKFKHFIMFFTTSFILLKHRFFIRKNHTLNCFRQDVEKNASIKVPDNNIDVPKILAYGAQYEIIASLSSIQMFNFIDKYNKIRTNRLHMAIAGALLNKKVEFYPNSYFKCEEVFKFSMKNKFPNIKWMD